MASKAEMIREKAVELLREKESGMHYNEMCKETSKYFPGTPLNTIVHLLWNLDKIRSDLVTKPSRGLFVHRKFTNTKDSAEFKGTKPFTNSYEEVADHSTRKIDEGDFYSKFADYLMSGISECNNAVPFGDTRGGQKWGNPDVIGWFDIGKAIFTQNPEIVSGELKIDSSWDKIVTGFGQACSYLLFSHKSYLAIPKQIKEGDRSRIESLCIIFGIGLIYFNEDDPKDPKFELRNRALRHEPNILYINERAKQISDALTKSNRRGV